MGADLSSYERTCTDIGFKPRTQAYGECVLEFDRRAKTNVNTIVSPPLSANATNLSPEDQQCAKFGFDAGTSPFADCRLKLEMNKRDALQRQSAYEAEQQRYQEQVAAAEKEKARQKSDAQIRYGLALMQGRSPNFSDNVNSANQSMGWAPPSAPTPPQLQSFIIQSPKGMTTCTVMGNMYNCN